MNENKALAGMILGLLSLLAFFSFAPAALVLAGFGLFFSIKGLQSTKKVFAWAGIISSSIMLAFCLMLLGFILTWHF